MKFSTAHFQSWMTSLAILTIAVSAIAGVPANRVPAQPAAKATIAGLSATLIADKDTYKLDPAQSGKDFRDKLANLQKNREKAPAAPAVDLTLRLTNTSDKDVQIAVGGDATQIELRLDGPGAVTVPNNVMMTMEFRIGRPVTIAPGKSYDVKITSLGFGMRGISQAAYWTEPGDYSLSATFLCTKDDGTQIKVSSDAAKLKLTK